jgi:hypothetical protein
MVFRPESFRGEVIGVSLNEFLPALFDFLEKRWIFFGQDILIVPGNQLVFSVSWYGRCVSWENVRFEFLIERCP